MNTQEQLLKFLLDSLKEGKELVVAQAPDVVQQWLKIQAMEYMAWAAILFIGFIAAIFLLIKSIHSDDGFLIIIATGVCFILFAAMSCNLVGAWEVKNAPKAYLFEQLRPGGCQSGCHK